MGVYPGLEDPVVIQLKLYSFMLPLPKATRWPTSLYTSM